MGNLTILGRVPIELTLLGDVAYRGQEVTAPRLRDLLALLAHDLRRGSGADRLVEGLWPDEQPENPAKALRVLVSRARALLGAELIENTPAGYRLALGVHEVDVGAIDELAARGTEALREGDHEAALTHAEAGLALWDGSDGDEYGPLADLRAGCAQAYRSLIRTRALALSLAGRHAEAVELLGRLAVEYPRDEEVLLELLRSEAATAGASKALTSYEQYRRMLRNELGADPGAALQALHRRLLRGEVVRTGVAHEPNALLGRDEDLTAIAGLLRASRVVTILGPGGVGKTRIAHAVSRAATCNVYFVPLAGVTEHVANEVASVVGTGEPINFRRPTDVLSGIVNAIGATPTLLVLDNCEHVLDSVADLVRALVSATSDVRILTTSRAALGLSSEVVYQLPVLPLATAAELFGQRARAARPDVELREEVVADLCRQLDGLPLAIELAAARVRIMSVTEIAARLHDRFALLRGGSRDMPQRHQTLHGVVEWSWNLLDERGRAAMVPLSVFPNGFTFSAAEHILGAGAAEILDLATQSLVRAVETPTGVRFQMLETVRDFVASHRDEGAIEVFLRWARDFGLAHHESVFGKDPIASALLIDAEQDNLLRALRYGIERRDGATVACVASVLTSMWLLASNYDMTEAHADEIAYVLTHYQPEPQFVEVTRTTAAMCAATKFMIQGPRAVRSLVVLRHLPSAEPDTLPRALAVLMIDGLDSAEGRLAEAASNLVGSYVKENELDPYAALAAARKAQRLVEKDSPWYRLAAHVRVGELCLQVGETEEARHHFMAALAVFPVDFTHVALSLVQTGLQAGDLDAAERWLASLMGDTSFPLGVRAELLLARGEIDEGLRMWRDTLGQLDPHEGTPYRVQSSGIDPWLNEIQAAVVVAHAQHGRLDLIDNLVNQLPARLIWLLKHPTVNPSPFLREFMVWGGLLLAVGMADLGERPRRAVRLIALAERFWFLRGFQPTMSPERVRRAAESADKVAYDEAVSAYATLTRDELRRAALAALADQQAAEGVRDVGERLVLGEPLQPPGQ